MPIKRSFQNGSYTFQEELSSIFYKTQAIKTISCGRCFSVGTLQENLAQYVRQKMDERNFSTYDVARRSQGAVTHAAIWGIINEQSKDVRLTTILAIATAFEVPPHEVLYGALGKTSDLASASGDIGLALDERQALLLWMFTDIPLECQLDTLASLAGVHQRRRLSARIHERHEARTDTQGIIQEKIEELRAATLNLTEQKPAPTYPKPRRGLSPVAAPLHPPDTASEEHQASEATKSIPKRHSRRR